MASFVVAVVLLLTCDYDYDKDYETPSCRNRNYLHGFFFVDPHSPAFFLGVLPQQPFFSAMIHLLSVRKTPGPGISAPEPSYSNGDSQVEAHSALHDASAV